MVAARAVAALALAALAATTGCSLITDSFLTNDFSGDPAPIAIDTTTGAIMVGMLPSGAGKAVPAVLDLLSPITVVDPCPVGTTCMADSVDPQVFTSNIGLFAAVPGSGPTVERAKFPEAQLIQLHPCDSGSVCAVGTPGATQPIGGVFGGNALAGDAIRLALGEDQMFVLPDIAGNNDRARSLSCDAVFDAPYRGGGTLEISGTELSFSNLRVAVQACLGPDPDPDPDPPLITPAGGPSYAVLDPTTFRAQGADAMFVVSTSIGISILGQSAYDRYRLAFPDANLPDSSALPASSVYLPSGPIQGHVATIKSLALVAAPSSNSLSPCRQLYAHRLLTTFELDRPDVNLCQLDANGHSPIDCPCKDTSTFCPVPAILELAPTGFDVLVIDDTDPTLQALRTELRPDQPEVDGILGTNVFRAAVIDVDYPHDRLLARCDTSAAAGSCRTRPQLQQQGDTCQIKRCIYSSDVPHHGCPKGEPLPFPCIVGATDGAGCPQ